MVSEMSQMIRVASVHSRALLVASAVVAVMALSWPASQPAEASCRNVHAASGANAAAIQPAVQACRDDLGALNQPGGRREINWDGVPDNRSAPNDLPPNFFNVNAPRGTVFFTPGSGTQVSADSDNPANAPIEFGNLNAAHPDSFQPFSAPRLFTAIGSNVVDVHLFVPATATPAVSNGFGVVFSDVDLAGSSSIEFIDARGKSLGEYDVPAGPNGGLSFLCVTGFKIKDNGKGAPALVRITSGNVAPSAAGSDGGGVDVAVTDDFILGEPQAFDPKGK